MNSYQEEIKKFCKDRNWSQFHNPKDLLLGIVEEIGELRNLIKWEQDPKVIRKVFSEKKEELADNIGDILWFLTILANSYDVNIDEVIKNVIEKNERRFPLKDTKDKHTNIYLGGHDGNY
jgi:NTP pyrophosphatase (non-canonical NTP hydrolase)